MDRTFIPEIAVGVIPVDLSGGGVVTLAAAWAAAQAANTMPPTTATGTARGGIDDWQYILLIDCEGNNARYRCDGLSGGAPTAVLGGRIIKDTQFVYTGASRSNMQFIAEVAANCKLSITVFRHVV